MEHNTIEETPEGLSLTVQVRFPLGLHARPAARLAQEAQQFEADVHLIHEDAQADAKSILDILSLAAAQGATLRVVAEGSDAREALICMADIFSGDEKSC